jgi:hypothetical protein
VRYASGSALASFVSGADDDARSAFLPRSKRNYNDMSTTRGWHFLLKAM